MTHFVEHYGLWVVFGVVFLEVAGLPFIPGETALITAAALASQGHGNIVAIIARRDRRGGPRRALRVRRRPPLGARPAEPLAAVRARHAQGHRPVAGVLRQSRRRRRSSSAGSCPSCARRSAGWPASAGCRSGASCSGTSPAPSSGRALIGLLAYYVGEAVIKAIEHDLGIGVARDRRDRPHGRSESTSCGAGSRREARLSRSWLLTLALAGCAGSSVEATLPTSGAALRPSAGVHARRARRVREPRGDLDRGQSRRADLQRARPPLRDA